jgi:uncharacterized membrane protein
LIMQPSRFFTREQKDRITAAVREAELNTSGEIRVHIERKCKGEALDRAAYLFGRLNMHRTRQRNGVLFYLAIDDHKFAILGDAGINAVTPDDFWAVISSRMEELFRQGEFTRGLVTGITMAGEQLSEHFPYRDDDVNELADDISFGTN